GGELLRTWNPKTDPPLPIKEVLDELNETGVDSLEIDPAATRQRRTHKPGSFEARVEQTWLEDYPQDVKGLQTWCLNRVAAIRKAAIDTLLAGPITRKAVADARQLLTLLFVAVPDQPVIPDLRLSTDPVDDARQLRQFIDAAIDFLIESAARCTAPST